MVLLYLSPIFKLPFYKNRSHSCCIRYFNQIFNYIKLKKKIMDRNRGHLYCISTFFTKKLVCTKWICAIQLIVVFHFLDIWKLIQSTSEAGLPCWPIGMVHTFSVSTSVYGPFL